jgi:hypothetical protein
VRFFVKHGVHHEGIKHWESCVIRSYPNAPMVFFSFTYRDGLHCDVPMSKRTLLTLVLEQCVLDKKVLISDLQKPRTKLIITNDEAMGGKIIMRILLKQQTPPPAPEPTAELPKPPLHLVN